jgi:hypothetical protein
LSEKLPLNQFEWLSDDEMRWLESKSLEECSLTNLEMIRDDADYGVILDISFSIDPHLHNKMNDLPFFAQRKKCGGTEKLVNTLEDSDSYVLHYRLLKLAMSHGVKLNKINRGIRFFQSNFIAPFITKNMELRKAAKHEFEKDIWK